MIHKKDNPPLVAIVGRVNVGKSTLFNRLIEQRKALVSTLPGTTRDLNYGLCEWDKRNFIAIDTGGLMEQKLNTQNIMDEIARQVESKAREIFKKCDAIIFLVDARDGLLAPDRQIAQLVRQSKKPFVLAANKTDAEKAKQKTAEFEKLGLGTAINIAAATGSGVGDLLDRVLKILPKKSGTKKIIPEKEIKVAIVGQPNTGKSSLLNQLMGEERVIVSALPHTTREPQDTQLEFEGHKIRLIDTAGIRRKSKVPPKSLERIGISMSVDTLKKSDIVLLMLDLSRNLTSQDIELARLLLNSSVSIILLANKYDLLEKDATTVKKLTAYFDKNFPFIDWAPVLYISAQNGRNCQKILPLILEVTEERKKVVGKKELNELLQRLFKKMPPPLQPKKRGGQIKSRAYISKIIQKDSNPPVFGIKVTNPIKIPEQYLNFLERHLREYYKFLGTPIKLVVERDEE